MESQYFDTFTLIVICGGLAVVVVGLALRQVESMKKNIPIWLFTGLMGILVGGGGTMVAMHGVGYHWEKPPESASDSGGQSGGMSGMGGAMPMMGGGGGGMPGMGGGMPGMGGGMGGGGGPRARRDLPALVGKLELLTRGLHLKLDAEQASKLAGLLTKLDTEDEMDEDAAKGQLDAITELLTADNKELLAAIDLPRGRAGGGPGGGAPVEPGGSGGPGGPGGGAPGGGGAQASVENPFKQEDNAKRLQSLRERFGAPAAGTKSSDGKPEEKPEK